MTTDIIESAIVEQARRLSIQRDIKRREYDDIVFWAENNFYAEATVDNDVGLIGLKPHQRVILRYAFKKTNDRFPFQTVIYSTCKKGGKTAIGGLVGRLSLIHI